MESRQAHPKDFKFIFNYSVWPKGVLEKEVKEGRWDVLRCPPDMLLRSEATPLWSRCRRQLRALGRVQTGADDEE